MNILIVEDNEDSRIMLCTLLENQNHNVKGASNGKKALQMIREWVPDIIVTDILMPEMDGYDLCREVKFDPELAHIPVIFYTATYDSEEDRKLGVLMGASRFILKPQEPESFIEIINEVIEQFEKEKTPVPQKPKESNAILNKMHLEAVAKKLQQKVKDLETERSERNKRKKQAGSNGLRI